MKIVIHGPAAGYGWTGSPALESWGPNAEVEVPDDNPKAVAWARSWVANGATLVQDVEKPQRPVKVEYKSDEKSSEPPKK